MDWGLVWLRMMRHASCVISILLLLVFQSKLKLLNFKHLEKEKKEESLGTVGLKVMLIID